MVSPLFFFVLYISFQGQPIALSLSFSLRENCPCLEFFWFVFPGVRTEYGEILLDFRMGKKMLQLDKEDEAKAPPLPLIPPPYSVPDLLSWTNKHQSVKYHPFLIKSIQTNFCMVVIWIFYMLVICNYVLYHNTLNTLNDFV